MRAKDCQSVWASTGEVEKVSPTQAGLNSDVIFIVSAEDKVEKAFDRVKASMLITWEPEQIGWTLHLDVTTQSLVVKCINDLNIWRLQAFLLVCHTFSMHKHFEPLWEFEV